MVHNNCNKKKFFFFEIQCPKKNKNEYFNLEFIIGSIINNRHKKRTETFFTFKKILLYIFFIYILYFINYK
ncbi:putative exported protein, partial [Plasmodium gaboni]